MLNRGEPAHAATIHLSKLTSPKPAPPTYSAIPLRHTNRFRYDRARPIVAAWLQALSAASRDTDVRLFLFEAGVQREAYNRAVIDATAAIISDPPMIADSDRWFRGTFVEISRFRSGPTFETAGLSPATPLMARMIPLSAELTQGMALADPRQPTRHRAPGRLIAVRDRYDRPAALAAGACGSTSISVRLWRGCRFNR